jgi:hypothetical protein
MLGSTTRTVLLPASVAVSSLAADAAAKAWAVSAVSAGRHRRAQS